MTVKESLSKGNHLAPVVVATLVAVVALPFAVEYRYVMDWDSVFRAFTGFAARDIITGFLNGSVRTLDDVKDVLTMYSDLYGARPGSLVSYTWGQTTLLGLMGFVSTNQYYLCLSTVACFAALLWCTAQLAEQLGLTKAGVWYSMLAIALHPAIFITIWSLRRGILIALAVSFVLLNLFRLLDNGGWRQIVLVVIGVCAGFLFHETAIIASAPAILTIVLVARRRKLEPFKWRRNIPLVALLVSMVLVCAAFSFGQFYLTATGHLSIFSKARGYEGWSGSPPQQFLTMSRYYTYQYGPEQYLGIPDEELEDVGAPELGRLVRGRGRLPVHHRIVYVLSTVFASVLYLPALLAVFLWRRFDAPVRRKLLVAGGMSLAYLLLLFRLGCLPDYVTPVFPGMVLWGGAGLSALLGRMRSRVRVAVTALLGLGLAVHALFYAFGFASGRFEEYPPRYDYDATAQRLLQLYPGEKFGVAADTNIAKNLAYSLYRLDKDRRVAVYTMSNLRPRLPELFTEESVPRYSYWLDMTRSVPGVRVVLARSEAELKVWEEYLEGMGLRGPMWSERCEVLRGRERWLAAPFRPLYMHAVTAEIARATDE